MGQFHQGAEVSTKVYLTANQQHTGVWAVVQNFCLPLEREKHLGGDLSPEYSNKNRSCHAITSHPTLLGPANIYIVNWEDSRARSLTPPL